MRRPSIGKFLVIAFAIATGGCSTFDSTYRYLPHPDFLETSVKGKEGARVTSLASVIGLRLRDRSSNTPAAMEIRLRVENHSGQRIELDATALSLIAANLEEFPPPITNPDGKLDIAPGESGELVALFPFPGSKYPDGYDLSGLVLRWKLKAGSETVEQSARFARRLTYYYYQYDPYYYYYPPGFHSGTGVGDTEG